jgi:hypothetical protein
MYFFTFRETNSSSTQPLKMCSKIEIFSLNLPSLIFTDEMTVFWQIPFVIPTRYHKIYYLCGKKV